MKGEIVSNTTNEGRYSKLEIARIMSDCGLTPREPENMRDASYHLAEKISAHKFNSSGSGSYCETIVNFLKNLTNSSLYKEPDTQLYLNA